MKLTSKSKSKINDLVSAFIFPVSIRYDYLGTKTLANNYRHVGSLVLMCAVSLANSTLPNPQLIPQLRVDELHHPIIRETAISQLHMPTRVPMITNLGQAFLLYPIRIIYEMIAFLRIRIRRWPVAIEGLLGRLGPTEGDGCGAVLAWRLCAMAVIAVHLIALLTGVIPGLTLVDGIGDVVGVWRS